MELLGNISLKVIRNISASYDWSIECSDCGKKLDKYNLLLIGGNKANTLCSNCLKDYEDEIKIENNHSCDNCAVDGDCPKQNNKE